MGEPVQGSDRHSARLDEEMARDPAVAEETADAELWDLPGRDGVVSDSEADPDRTDLRAAIASYVAGVSFPASGDDLTSAAESADAPPIVIERLAGLDRAARLASPSELWTALGLAPGRRG
jgi:hypothetical protein